MKNKVSIIGFNFVSVLLIFQLTGCGTLLHGERKGQTCGRIDAGVAILDGLGLLFFVIPGIIAFAVDFSNGTIYLPDTCNEKAKMKEIKFDPKRTDQAALEKIIEKETGRKVNLKKDGVRVVKMESLEDIEKVSF